MPKLYTYPATPDEIVTLIGRIAIESSFMDMLLGSILLARLKESGKHNPQGIYALPTKRKIERLGEEFPDAELKPILTRAEAALLDRNLALHGIAAATDTGILANQTIAFRDKYSEKPQPRSAELFRTILDAVAETSGDLMAHGTARGLLVVTKSVTPSA